MTDQTPKNFWATVPGIMTGTASLLTAVLAMMTFSVAHCRNDKAAKGPQSLNLSRCQEITGTWSWFTGGEVTISPDGGLVWHQNPTNPAAGLTAIGVWACFDSTPRTYTLSWQTGLTDDVTLSPDHKSLTGTNRTTHAGISGVRRSG